MENRPQIFSQDHLTKALSLCIDIQNGGIATVFVDFFGHVNKTGIRMHLPVWISGGDPTYQFELFHDQDEYDDYILKNNQDVLNKLSEILTRGTLSVKTEQQLIQEKEREIRFAQYKELRKEFEKTEIQELA